MAFTKPRNREAYARYTDDDQPNGLLLGWEYELYVPGVSTDGLRYGTLYKTLTKHLPEYFKWTWEPFGNHTQYGPEIRSPIAPLEMHDKWISKLIKSPIPWNKMPNGSAHGAGIHVHVERSKNSEPQARKVFDFLHGELTDKQCLTISARCKASFNRYSKRQPRMWYNPTHRDSGDGKDSLKKTKVCYVREDWGPKWEDKYYILNERDKTFEFRLFSAHPDLLLPACQMIESLFLFARIVPKGRKIRLDDWLIYLTKNKRTYSELHSYLEGLKL